MQNRKRRACDAFAVGEDDVAGLVDLSSVRSTTDRVIGFSFAAALLLAGCAQPTAQSAEGHAHAKPVHVDSVLVVTRDMPNTLLLAGTLKPNQESELAANATGRVTRTTVERGSYVGRGSIIAQLDTRAANLSAMEAEANAQTQRAQKAHADDECARYDGLFQRGAITKQEYERQTSACKTATSSTAAAETRVELTKQTLADGTVRAPFPGLVSERYVSVGEYVMPSTRVAHVVDIDPLRLELTIPEQNLSAVKMGQLVQFQVGAYPNQSFEGTVHYIGPAVRATTRDLVFEALVPNKEKLLRPGLFATAHLDVGTQKLPVVPKSAIKQDGDTTRVFAVVDKHVEERVVQLGPAVESVVAVVKGLVAGERIADRPSDQLSDGVEVE
jgi:membrane fusion protein, multidrug efflux system